MISPSLPPYLRPAGAEGAGGECAVERDECLGLLLRHHAPSSNPVLLQIPPPCKSLPPCALSNTQGRDSSHSPRRLATQQDQLIGFQSCGLSSNFLVQKKNSNVVEEWRREQERRAITCSPELTQTSSFVSMEASTQGRERPERVWAPPSVMVGSTNRLSFGEEILHEGFHLIRFLRRLICDK